MPYSEQNYLRGLNIKNSAKKYLDQVFSVFVSEDGQLPTSHEVGFHADYFYDCEFDNEYNDADDVSGLDYKTKVDKIANEIHCTIGACETVKELEVAHKAINKQYKDDEPYADLAVRRVLGDLLWDTPTPKLTAIMIPPSITKIGRDTLMPCENILYLVIPQTVKKIHPEAFRSCANLSRVIFLGTCDEWLKRYYGCPLMCDVHCADGCLKFTVVDIGDDEADDEET